MSSIRAARIEPFEVFLARLDDRRQGDLRSTNAARLSRSGVTSGLTLGSKLVVARTSPGRRRHNVFAVTRIERRERADVQSGGLGRPVARDRPCAVEGGGVEVEGIARAGRRRAAHDEGERRRAGDRGRRKSRSTPSATSAAAKASPLASADTARQRRPAAEPRQADGDVVGRAAEHRVIAAGLIGAGIRSISASPETENHLRSPPSPPAASRQRIGGLHRGVELDAHSAPCSRGPRLEPLRPPNGAWKSTPAVGRLTITMPASALRLKCVRIFQAGGDRCRRTGRIGVVGDRQRLARSPCAG